MNDDEGARLFEAGLPFHVPRETMAKLHCYAKLLREENAEQNLIGRSTVANLWVRHFLDSAQLVALAPRTAATWLDVGSGAGLPGIVTALLTSAEQVLIEPRRRRAEFLERIIEALDLKLRVRVVCAKIEKFARPPVDVITARAFAPLSRTLASTSHLAGSATIWLLNKGRGAATEIAEAKLDWGGSFDLVPSLTDPEASVLQVAGLRRDARP